MTKKGQVTEKKERKNVKVTSDKVGEVTVSARGKGLKLETGTRVIF